MGYQNPQAAKEQLTKNFIAKEEVKGYKKKVEKDAFEQPRPECHKSTPEKRQK